LQFIFVPVIFLVGLIIGFLINTTATRIAAHRPLLGRLHCTRSSHPITFAQAIPVLGYFIQRGRCSTCAKKISISYPLVELATAGLLVAGYLIEGFGLPFVFHSIYVAFLMLVLIIDWKHKDIYVLVIAAGCAIAFVGSFLLPEVTPWGALIGAGVAGAFFLLAYVAARLIFPKIEEPLGAGDILLALMMGVMLGWPNIVGALLIGPLIAGAAAILLLLSRRSQIGDFMPYGVALCAAAILFLVYPTPIAEALHLPALSYVVSNMFNP
jgi:prepilin signal peptidase PulO-like enzyme (type II secretory pathway)